MKKNLLTLSYSILLFPFLSFSQKAYDAVRYMGKTQNISVKFTLANGYISASEIKTTDAKTKKVSLFLPEDESAADDKKLKFIHAEKAARTFSDYFILNGMEEVFDHPPATISGTYYYKEKAFPFTIKKQ